MLLLPTDTTADGGGFTLKGSTDKTFNWVNSTDSFTASENIDLASGKTYKINNVDVLSSTTLGSTVVKFFPDQRWNSGFPDRLWNNRPQRRCSP